MFADKMLKLFVRSMGTVVDVATRRPPVATFKPVTSSSSKGLEVLDYNDKAITLVIDSRVVKYSNIFLRDSCSATGKSIHADSKQKLFTTASLHPQTHPLAPPKVANGVLEVEWFDGVGKPPHKSTYSTEFLSRYSSVQSRKSGVSHSADMTLWNRATLPMKDVSFEYEAYMTDPAVFTKALRNLNRYGLVFVNGIPDQKADSPWFVQNIAERIGYIKRTFYGDLFDVVSKPGAENLAYTNTFLPLHMDLLYYESPPGLQLLHSIKNSTAGGENKFADSFAAAQYISERDPSVYFALTTVPVPYHYHNNGEHYYYSRPVVVEHETLLDGAPTRVKECNYSPPFQAPFEFGITHAVPLPFEEEVARSKGIPREIAAINNSTTAMEIGDSYLFKDFLKGFKMFEDHVNDPENQIELKLPEGTCVVFDNRRVLHSRNEFHFENGKGERWLKGCYLDRDTFLSRLRVINETNNL